MKPPIQYFGSKGTLADQIVNLLPTHKGYIEPFAGSLAVLLAKPPSKIEVVNDLDGRLVTFWRVLRDRPDELIRAASLTPHSREELNRAEALDADDEVELARQVWVMLTQGRSRTLKRTGWRFFSDPNGTSASFHTYMDAYRDRLGPAFERIRHVSLECRPALEVIEQYGEFEDSLLYVDPPYPHETRRGFRYDHEMTADDHRAMAAALHRAKATVVLSGYACELYDDELFPDWDRHVFTAQSGNSLERSAVEVLWSNRTLGNFLFGADL